jgi:NTP pyrophosphatase (non-canonical NTP hydrolase)
MMIWEEVQAERERAHAKHGDTSMEALPVDDLTRLTVLTEEVGEVARCFNEARHRPPLDAAALREELIQVAAMAGAWADALPTHSAPYRAPELCPRCLFRTTECAGHADASAPSREVS